MEDTKTMKTTHTPTAKGLLRVRPFEWSEEEANYALKLVSNHNALVEALRSLVVDIEYLVEEGTLPKEALNHASYLKSNEALKQAERGE
jgi:hypothetical protein